VNAIHERYSAVLALETTLSEDEMKPLSEVTRRKLDWLESKMEEVLDRQYEVFAGPGLVSEDGKALVKILNTPSKREYYQEKYVWRLRPCLVSL
jgi:hypothetical protein